MINLLIEKLQDQQFMIAMVVAVAAAATVLTVAMPILAGDSLGKRMKAVSVERDRIRARERERLAKSEQKVSLRQAPKAYMKNIVDRFSLSEWLGTDNAKKQLVMAGYRGSQAEVTFLFFRLIAPIGFFAFATFYLFVVNSFGWSAMIRVAAILGATSWASRRPKSSCSTPQEAAASIRRAWPDSLDLLLICVESGMSVEQAFRRVSVEVGVQSIPLAEELTLTTAELSYLGERRLAYENLSTRTGIDGVKAVATALIQAERYGTPVGTALRVLAQESRDQRMNEAEKKAAGLPPKLTVPMILFFLPVLFVVILTPALIKVFGWHKRRAALSRVRLSGPG